MFAQEIAQSKGLLQGFDPRAKMISAIIFLITINLSNNLLIIAVINLFTIIIALLSKIPLNFFLKRVWVFLPVFTGVVAIPIMFNIFSPGTIFVSLVNIPSLNINLSITYPGIMTAMNLIVRVATSVGLIMLFVLTTRWMDILRALEVIRIPSVFITILGMTYRYIYVFLSTTENMILARKSRLVGKLTGKEERNVLLSSLGVLFLKSFTLSENVYLAMQSRGYKGRTYTMTNFTWKIKDIVGIIVCIITCIFVLKI